MGVRTDVVMADLSDAPAVLKSASPANAWEGFSFNGFHHIQLGSLLSLLKTGDPYEKMDWHLGQLQLVSLPSKVSPLVFAVKPAEVEALSALAAMEEEEFESLAEAWAATEEFTGWSEEDVSDLLRQLGDLAESAALQSKHLMLWQTP